MIIQCDECQAKFKLDDSKISDKGAKVRCSKCKHVFTVRKAAAPPVEDESFGMDFPEDDDLFGEEGDSFDSFDEEESALDSSAEAGDGDLSWGGLAGNLDGLDIEFEEPESEKAIKSDVAGFDLEEDNDVAGFDLEEDSDVAGFGLEGDSDVAGFGLEGDSDSAGFGLEGDSDSAGFGLEGDSDSAGFGLEEDSDSAGFGLEEDSDSAGFGLEGDSDSAGFGLEGESATTEADKPSDSGFADLDLDTGPDLGEGLDVTDSPADNISEEQEQFNPAESDDMSDEEFERSRDIKTDTKARLKAEKNSPKLLILILISALTLGGAYYVITSKADVVIAGYDIGQMLRNSAASLGISSQPERSGKIEISDLNGYYLQSEKDGLIFVIEGSALNNFDGPRSFISIKGTLYDGSGKQVVEQSAFCGNIFTKDELATLSRKKITLDLQSKLGKGLINSNIPPGKKIPFMLVFYSVPDNLAEFNVEATGSEDTMQNAE
ncbi:MAG: DUF3426 domain-containing protein [bacterium]|nr:DUF3426 domain-containing protein [bacterium]